MDVKYKAKVLSVIHHGQEYTRKNDLLYNVEITCPECQRSLVGCHDYNSWPPHYGFCLIKAGPSNVYQLRCDECECVFSIRVEDRR